MVVKKYNWIELTQKIHASRGGCEMHANQFLVGMASPVSEILLLLKFGQISFSDHGLQSVGVKKYNQIELAENIHASRC